VNHLRSLGSIDDPVDGPRVRAKREAEAEYLANLIQARQTTDPTEPIISVGDYNAFEVSDGYVDVLGAIKGTPAPASQVVLSSPSLVNPPLTDLLGMLPAAQQYSYVFDGDAQTLDHELVTQSLVKRMNRVAYARNDADFPETFRNDATRPERISDHDLAVAYLNLAPVADITPQFTVTMSALTFNRATRLYSGTITVVNNGGATNGPVSVVLTNVTPGVTVVSPSGTYNASPYLMVPNTSGGMAGAQTLTVPVKFDNPSNALIQAVLKVYSGPLN
jgi:hypothetical protein